MSFKVCLQDVASFTNSACSVRLFELWKN